MEVVTGVKKKETLELSELLDEAKIIQFAIWEQSHLLF